MYYEYYVAVQLSVENVIETLLIVLLKIYKCMCQ